MIRKNHIPSKTLDGFMVIEPINPQFRVLKKHKNHPDPRVRRLARELKILTPGNERLSPVRHNPLRIPLGATRDEHSQTVLTLLDASIPLPGPVRGILGEALEEAYDRMCDTEDWPTMHDLLSYAEKVLARKGYSGQTGSDIRAAIHVRLGDLTRRATGRLFQCVRDIPDTASVLTSFSVYELNHMADNEVPLEVLAILLPVREYVQRHYRPNQGLRFVIIIDEGHLVAGVNRDAKPSEEFADPSAFASNLIRRFLAEMRVLGVGVIIADQHASEVARHVSKTTSTKLVLRETAPEDCDDVSATTVMTDTQKAELPRLGTGEAFLYREGYHSARRIQIPNLYEELILGLPPSDSELLDIISNEPWYEEAARLRVQTELTQLRRKMDDFDDHRVRIVRETVHLLKQQALGLTQTP